MLSEVIKNIEIGQRVEGYLLGISKAAQLMLISLIVKKTFI